MPIMNANNTETKMGFYIGLTIGEARFLTEIINQIEYGLEGTCFSQNQTAILRSIRDKIFTGIR